MVTYASVLLATGRTSGIEEKLRAAEQALEGVPTDERTRDVIDRIAATRAMLALGQDDLAALVTQTQRALAYPHPDNLAFRTSATWRLGYAHQRQGERAEARDAFSNALAASHAAGNTITEILAALGLDLGGAWSRPGWERFSAVQQAAIEAEVLGLLQPYEVGDRLDIPVELNLAVASR